MRDRDNRKLEMFNRVRDFGVEHAADFAPNSFGSQLLARIDQIVDELDNHGARQTSSRTSSKQGTTTRAQARADLRDTMEAINRTAKAMAHEVSGLDDKFRLPRGTNDQILLTSARAFATDAEQYQQQFIAREHTTDFLDDLNDDIHALEIAMRDQSSGRTHGAGAGADIDDTIDRGMVTVHEFDAVVRNKYRNNSGILAEWTSASHLERDPHRHSQTPSTQSPPPPTSSGEGSAPPA